MSATPVIPFCDLVTNYVMFCTAATTLRRFAFPLCANARQMLPAAMFLCECTAVQIGNCGLDVFK
jgi:hypothetical protein